MCDVSSANQYIIALENTVFSVHTGQQKTPRNEFQTILLTITAYITVTLILLENDYNDVMIQDVL